MTTQGMQLLTCGIVKPRYSCQASSTFHRGEIVRFVANGSEVQALEMYVSIPGRFPVRLRPRSHISSSQHCIVAQYKIPTNAQIGWSHVSVVWNQRTSVKRSQLSFEVSK